MSSTNGFPNGVRPTPTALEQAKPLLTHSLASHASIALVKNSFSSTLTLFPCQFNTLKLPNLPTLLFPHSHAPNHQSKCPSILSRETPIVTPLIQYIFPDPSSTSIP